eukprot:CAMPEP_0117431140 /NCGR_PEP_ID=MMETSP0758-20121206/10683_1 /TAXON_ID=63605 /ORGANISM="Percolomonas cosmopolitus, Strain AE-1 (ATCC 50343)" /LENGTH=276 /DNA_ID=CAMNT_0005219869 /DNA_START=120 /DNA_END=947 /DNA_ORIENTATION=-
MYVIGGKDATGQYLDDIQKYHIKWDIWETSPIKLRDPSDNMGVIVYESVIYIFGGNNNTQTSNIMQKFELESCQCLSNTNGYGCSSFNCLTSTCSYHGECTRGGCQCDDAYTIDPTCAYLTEQALCSEIIEGDIHVNGTRPVARNEAIVAVFNNTIYVFGGSNGTLMNDTWTFDQKQLTWELIPQDSINSGDSRIFVTYKNMLFTYGGLEVFNAVDHVYSFNFTAMKWKKITTFNNPGQIMDGAAVVYQEYMMVFGGNFLFPRNEIVSLHLETFEW